MTKRIITAPNAPGGLPYSQAVIAAGLGFVAGQGPINPSDGSIVGMNIQEVAREEADDTAGAVEPRRTGTLCA